MNTPVARPTQPARARALLGAAVLVVAPTLAIVYAARLLAGAGAAAIVPTAQAYVCDASTSAKRSRRVVPLGSASFLGLIAGPALGSWLAGPVMAMGVGQMPSMVNWPTLLIAAGGLPILLLAPWGLARERPVHPSRAATATTVARRRFALAPMVLAMLALHPAAPFWPFWMAAIVLLFGAGAAHALWGAARDDEILTHDQRRERVRDALAAG